MAPSDLVVLGKFTEIGVPITSSGWVMQSSRFQVQKVLKGDLGLRGTSISATLL